VGVSTDTMVRHRRFRELNRLPFPLVADPDHHLSKLFDVRRRFGLGTSRVTYMIDKAGTIRGVFHNELSMSSHVSTVLAALQKLQGPSTEAIPEVL